MQKNWQRSSEKSLSSPSSRVYTNTLPSTIHSTNHIDVFQKVRFTPELLDSSDVQVLQRTIGNRAIQRVLTKYDQHQSETAPKPTATLSSPTRSIIARAVSPEYPAIKEKLSYGFFDWAITDQEARDVLDYLSALSPADLNDTVRKMKGDGLADRLLDNITDSDRRVYASLIRSIQHPAPAPATSTSTATPLPPATKEDQLKAKITELNKTINDPNQSFGEIAKAITIREDLQHDLAIEQRGYGKYKGSQSTDSRAATETSCIEYVMAVLGEAFEKKGQRTQWEKIRRIVVKNQLKGTVLLETIQSHLGWKGVFWAPDTKNPEDKDSEHPYAARIANKRGKYYGVKVEKDKSVIDYRPTDSTQKPVEDNLNKLKKVPFGLLIARGGKHTALIVEGTIYEIHWDIDSTSLDVIESSSFENWAWLSGMILMPPEDMKHVW